MDFFESVKSYGAFGGLAFLLGLAIKFNVAELIFHNKFDRIFWGSSKKSISSIMLYGVLSIGVFTILLILGSISISISENDGLVKFLTWVLFVLSLFYFYLVIQFALGKKWWMHDRLKDQMDNLSIVMLILSGFIFGNYSFEVVGKVTANNDFSFNNQVFVSMAGFTYIITMFLYVHTYIYEKYVERHFLIDKNDNQYIATARLQNGLLVIKNVKENEDIFIKEDQITDYRLKKIKV